MDDAISRQAAIDEISKYASIWMEYDADMTQEEVAEAALKAAKRTMVHILEELPSTQPEIVRCKDCKNAEERGCALFCGFWTRYTAHKGYCFKAERRTDE